MAGQNETLSGVERMPQTETGTRLICRSGSEPVPLADYHLHTIFCDGNDAPEAMVRAALEQGVRVLGFSAHACYPEATDWHLPINRYADYCTEIRRLASVYGDRITVLCGFEVDYIPGVSIPSYSRYAAYRPDYLIGSVHYVSDDNPGNRFTVDGPVEELRDGLARVFRGDARRLVETYFEREREMVALGDFEIIGHPDLIRKRNGVLRFFDERADWYRAELVQTADAIARSGKIVEVNTGGMARRALDDTYPSDTFLALLLQRGVPVMINSDAHSAQTLLYGFDFARTKLERIGRECGAPKAT
ncbi:MAG: histidinol-phosphatase [Kiritimatiellae bacterium]|nr:histidinol-phosphatase [Kiritimatiellia bacterium]